MLSWYDRHARALPWRTSPQDRQRGVVPTPYHVWLSEVMLQQTTVATVIPRFEAFLARWPTVDKLAAAPLEDVLGEWAGLGYYARARNLHACAQAVVDEFGADFPQTEEALLTLPGIGPYTAAAIAAIAFDVPATVVDGNIDRVMIRQFGFDKPIREIKPEIYAAAEGLTPKKRAGDYAQSLMDLGATICRPKAPQCLLCPVQKSCIAHGQGIADQLPVKPPKKQRPIRYGTVYVGILRKNNAVLTERRPAKGLFGGMAGLPGSAWATVPSEEPKPPLKAQWKEIGEIEHTLTHFHLKLKVMYAEISSCPKPFFETMPEKYDTFPTVFKKAIQHIEKPPK
ncbi:MAG: A/G-specific adenine glycosylase [Pseudomonadota bacterium]